MKKITFALALLAFGFGVVPIAGAKKATSSFDAKFLDQFTEHHKDAIRMGELALSKAENPGVKKIARKMVSDQEEEVAQMQKWRERLYSSAPRVKSEMPKMDMSGLRGKSGKDFDLAFLDMMAKHHEQGIDMAKKAADKLFNPRIKIFAQNAVMNQDRERQELDDLKSAEATASDSSLQ